MSDRIYSQDEVSAIIRRAVELEAERSVTGDSGSGKGLTISELEQIAAESGIDPELVQKAASDFEKFSAINENKSGEKAEVKKKEIVSERWLNINVASDIMDDMVTELNHKYGTSDKDINWWDDLWKNYEGKAKVRKTSTSLEWHYTDNMGYYSTRVLLQNRGGKFRIRVSKMQLWGMNWNTGEYEYIFPIFFFPIFIALGGVFSFSFMDSIWPGIAAGAVLATMLYPAIKYFRNQSLSKHQEEVMDTVETLTDLATQFINLTKSSNAEKRSRKEEKDDLIQIEIDDHEEQETESSKLRNNLREKAGE